MVLVFLTIRYLNLLLPSLTKNKICAGGGIKGLKIIYADKRQTQYTKNDA
jgi:hypothetical protein